jgi:hypothetical protein
MILLDLALVIGGYVIAVFTWSKVKVWVNGAQAEAENLKVRADAILATARKV